MTDLFTDPAETDLKKRLQAVFQAYVDERARASPRARREVRPLREESAAVYRDVWGSFAEFCASRNLSLESIDAEDLELFVAGLGDGEAVTARYTRRVLALLERIFRFESLRSGTRLSSAVTTLLARPEYRFATEALAEPSPEYLNARQSTALIQYVTATAPDPRSDDAWAWPEVRDRTAVALQLGAGITPGEVQCLRLQDVVVEGGRAAQVPWKLRLPANGNVPMHESPIAPWAGRQLAYWLQVRAQAGIPGDWVFPSTRPGNAWSKMRCYLACQAVLQAAGVHDSARGNFRLRHTYVLRQMANGKTETEIAHWLGLQDTRSMARYRRVLPAPVAVI
jgi:site-specific recombinase XerD